MQLEGVIFDLDGTLGDTVYVSVEAIIRAAESLTSETHSHPDIIAMFGPTELGILRQLLPRQDWEQGYQIFLQEYRAIHQTGQYGAYPGIHDVVALLQEHGMRRAIVTGKGRQTAEISLRYFGLESAFEALETGSVEGSAKEACIKKVVAGWGARPETVLYVGDAPTDIAIARRAGVRPVSAAWAETADPAELAAMKPYRLFNRVADLENWLKRRLNGLPPKDSPYVS